MGRQGREWKPLRLALKGERNQANKRGKRKHAKKPLYKALTQLCFMLQSAAPVHRVEAALAAHRAHHRAPAVCMQRVGAVGWGKWRPHALSPPSTTTTLLPPTRAPTHPPTNQPGA